VKQVSGKEFIRIIQKHGWVLKRINGSHHIFHQGGPSGTHRHPGSQKSTVENRAVETPDENSRTDRS